MNPQPGERWSATDGPRDKPNGKLCVLVKHVEKAHEGEVTRFFICEVLEAVMVNGKTASPGDTVRLHYSAFDNKLE